LSDFATKRFAGCCPIQQINPPRQVGQGLKIQRLRQQAATGARVHHWQYCRRFPGVEWCCSVVSDPVFRHGDLQDPVLSARRSSFGWCIPL